MYSLKFKAKCSFKKTIFIEHWCVSGNSRNIYSKIIPSHFIIIISFAITISWIKYSYNFCQLKLRMKKLLIWSRVPYYNKTVNSCSRFTTFLLFGSCFHRQNLPNPNALRYLHRLNADVSENTLPFVSQSINNFSDYDKSQSVDWECPSLSPHVLLVQLHHCNVISNVIL